MAWYMGPTTSVTHILQKLSVIFDTTASFDILMENFYKVTQGNKEKVLSSTMRLEGTLNQIQLQCPRRMTDLEAQQHLKDHLFHGVCKHIHDSIWYLYSTPSTSYLQLMVTAQKAQSKNEEIQDKMRARAMVTTDQGEGTTELEQQTAKLMATLTQAGQGNGPSSVPGSPKERGHTWGCNSGDTPSHPNSHNGRDGPGQMIPA